MKKYPPWNKDQIGRRIDVYLSLWLNVYDCYGKYVTIDATGEKGPDGVENMNQWGFKSARWVRNKVEATLLNGKKRLYLSAGTHDFKYV